MISLTTRHIAPTTIIILSIWVLLEIKQHLSLRQSVPLTVEIFPRHNDTLLYTPQSPAELVQKKKFIDIEVQSETYDFSSLTDLCNSARWTNKVVFTCNDNAGGIGNVRNEVLSCVRFAIEAGGSLVMPQIRVRNQKDIADMWTSDRIGMDYLFDAIHFKQTLNEYCPQLILLDEVPSGSSAKLKMEILEKEYQLLKHPDQWRKKFDNWRLKNPSEVIHQGISFQNFPIHYDSLTFSNNFGRILRFRPDVQRLAAAVLYDLHRISLSPLNIGEQILPNLYLGAHLRTESDSRVWSKRKYGSFEVQTDAYIQQASQQNLSLIYVASGDADEIYRLQEKAPEFSIVDKFMLLEYDDVKELEALTFDQQALVDWLVLLKASSFGGVSQSSFSWNIALRRHILSDVQNPLDGPQMFSDEFSTIYGKVKDSKNDRTVNPDGLWP